MRTSVSFWLIHTFLTQTLGLRVHNRCVTQIVFVTVLKWHSKFEHASKVSFAEKSKEDKTISCKVGYRSESDKFISETIQSLDSCRCSWFSPPELVTMPVISSLTCRTHSMNDFCLPWSHWIGNTEATRKFSRFRLTKKHLYMEAILVWFLFCLPRFALIICSRQ